MGRTPLANNPEIQLNLVLRRECVQVWRVPRTNFVVQSLTAVGDVSSFERAKSNWVNG